MPTYEFLHRDCQNEWELELSIKAPDPTHCPKCNGEENIVRLISGGSGKGIVELVGQDLVDKVKADTQQLKRDMYSSEKVYSNVLGESKYQALQQRLDKQKRDHRR
jgi:putative FmdB family regulatory protein